MNLFSKLTVFAVAAAASVLTAAEVIDLTAKDFWTSSKNVTFAEGEMTAKSRIFFRSKKAFDIDPTKKYTISMDITAGEGTKSAKVYYGLYPVSKTNKMCEAHNIQSIANTFTKVVADVKKGDTEIKVKNAAKWTTSTSAVFALDAKEDNSDIPNFNILKANVAKKVKEGDIWVVTLKKPVTRDIKAGTFIRQHAMGGYYYFNYPDIAPGKTVSSKNTVTGKANYGYYSLKGIHPAVTRAYIIILSNWNSSGTPLTYKNAKLIIE